MADKSGTIEFPIASSKLQGKIDWTSTSNGATANTSTVVATLYARRTDGYSTTGQSWSGYVKIGSTQKNISFSSSVTIGSSWYQMAQVTATVAHNNDGTGSATISGSVTGPSGTSLAGITSSKSETVTLEKIARGTSITSFTISKRNETSLNFNWATADNVEALYYSTDNGSHWKNANISGTNYGNFFADTNTANNSALTPNTTYQCKIYVVKNTITTYSSQVSATTNAAPTISLSSKTETSITMAWSIDDTASKIKYSTNNGSSWSGEIDVNAKSGTYTITGLAANTTYNIKFNIKRKGPQTWYPTATSSQTTYNYPYVTAVGSSTLTIGNSQTLTLYNPLGRSCTIKMYQTNTSGTQLYSGTTSSTSITFTPTANTLYASIPNATSSKCVYSVTYSSSTKTTSQYTYQVNTSSCIPTFSNFAYKDTATSELITTIANNQTIVQNVSNVNLVISTANKMVAKNSATESKYQATFSNLSKTITYSSSEIDTNIGTPTGSGNQTFKVTAYDSRSISKEVSKTINIIPYTAPVVNVALSRLNGFENETHLKVTGTFTRVTISNSDKNLIKSVQYRYKESTASSWGSWTTMTISSQGTGSYQTTELTLSFDNTKQYDFQIRTTDRAKTTIVSKTLSVGQPLMFLDTSGNLEVQSSFKIPKNGNAGKGITNTDGESIIRDHNNQNVTVDATGKTLYLGFANTTGLNILNGQSTINSNGQYLKSSGGQYIKARDNAVVRQTNTATNNWSPVVSVKTKNGEWSIGKDQSSDSLNFQYTTDTDYDNNTNTGTRYTINTSGNYSGNAATATRATNSTYSDVTETNPTSTTNYYGTFVTELGQNKSLRGNNGFIYRCYQGTASAEGVGILVMGNSTAKGTAGNKRGYLRLYDSTTHYGELNTNGSFTANRSLTMPNHNGTIQVRPTNLYNNTSGSTGTITLSETSANFNYLEIFYCDNNGANYKCVRVYSPNGKKTEISSIEPATNKASTYIRTSMYTISGTSITRNGSTYVAIDNKAITVHDQSAYNKIVRVDGWR